MEPLSDYNLNIVYWASKKNPANAPSYWPDYVKVVESPAWAPEGLSVTMIVMVQCNAMFWLWQLYAVAVKEEQIFKAVPTSNTTDSYWVAMSPQ